MVCLRSIVIFINCNWVVTRWQWLFNTYTKHICINTLHKGDSDDDDDNNNNNNIIIFVYLKQIYFIQCKILHLIFLPSNPVIRDLGFAYPYGYEQGHLGVREKNLNSGGKGTYIYHWAIYLQLQHINLK
jgi:hypothetical protein